MSRKNRHFQKEPAASATESPAASKDGDNVKTSGWSEAERKTVRREFPEAGLVDEPVRIAMSAQASADVFAHAKQSLSAEVCGVLVGELCEDGLGVWVSVKAAIRGTSAKQGSTHVTYTQETWDKIYKVKDRDYPKLAIVGWYHTHPGFGVEFSDMDLFIQRNFFSGPSQFALVVDPLGGEEAICVNSDDGIAHVKYYWVDGRRRTCRMPSARPDTSNNDNKYDDESSLPAMSSDAERRLKAVEDRLSQLLQAIEEDRAGRHRVALFSFFLVALACSLWIANTVYQGIWSMPQPPEHVQWASMPIQIDGEPALVGIEVKKWQLPERLKTAWIEAAIRQMAEAEQQRREAEEAAQKAAEEATQPADTKAQSEKSSSEVAS